VVILFVVTLTDSEVVDMVTHLSECVDSGDEANGGTSEVGYISVRTCISLTE
jgi:hypothetical protein